ncbi:filamentous hemagglutinin / adhesin domain protein [Burkholderia cenocepacia]|nr:filamentous hemagglutinin / adhesin domain protein [Burkholderia cenocepacia]
MVRFAELMSNIVAGKDVTGIAKEVTIDASQTDRRHEETHEVKSSGFTLAVKSPVIDAIQNVNQQAQGAGGSQDGRAAPPRSSRRVTRTPGRAT